MFVYTTDLTRKCIEFAFTDDQGNVCYPSFLKPIEKISSKQKKHMFSTFAKDCKFEDALFYCDETFFNSGKEGFIVSKDAIYFSYGYIKFLDSSVIPRHTVFSFYGIKAAELYTNHAKVFIRFLFENNHATNYECPHHEEIVRLLNPVLDIRHQLEKSPK